MLRFGDPYPVAFLNLETEQSTQAALALELGDP